MKMTKEKMRAGVTPSHLLGGGEGIFCRFVVGVLCLGSALAARATEWKYNSEDSTITDGQWTIVVDSDSDFRETKTLTMSQRLLNGKYYTAISGYATPTETSLLGVLDLRSPLVVTDDDGTETTIQSVEIGQSALGGAGTVTYSITKLYCDIISSMGSSCFAANSKMTVIDIGGTADTIPQYAFNNCPALKTINLDFPDLRKIEMLPFGQSNSEPNSINVSTWAPPGVTNIYGFMSSGGWRSKVLYGDLVLTNVVTLGGGAFFASQLTNVYLKGDLTTLPQTADNNKAGVFQGSYTAVGGIYGTITNLVFDLPKLTRVDANAFFRQGRIGRVEFVTPLEDMNLLTNIVGNVQNSTIDELCIYVSKKMWKAKESETYSSANTSGVFAAKDTLTDEEKATIDAETLKNVIGVFVKGGVRKGLFVHKPSIYDPQRGLFILIR